MRPDFPTMLAPWGPRRRPWALLTAGFFLLMSRGGNAQEPEASPPVEGPGQLLWNDDSDDGAVVASSPEAVTPPRLAEPLPRLLPVCVDERSITATIVVAVDGSVEDVEVAGMPRIHALPFRALLRQVRFHPATRGGEPIRVRIPYEVPLQAISQCVPVQGRIVDFDGYAVAGARVVVRSLEEGTSMEMEGVVDAAGPEQVTTDNEGRFQTQPRMPGEVRVAVRAPGMLPLDETLAHRQGGELLGVMDILPDGETSVTVTGSRREERAGSGITQVQVIEREDLVRGGIRDVGEALEEQMGVQVQRTFAGTTLSMRGLDPEYVLILVDGDRLVGRTGGAIDLSRFGVESVERIEVVRGPSSAIYGSDAIGGVVNIITRQSQERFSGNAMASVGSAGVIDGTAFLSARPFGEGEEGLQLSIGGGFHNSGSYQIDDTREATSGSARRQWSLLGTVRYDEGGHRLRLTGNYIRTDLRGVDSGAGTALFDRQQLQEQAQVAIEHRVEREDIALRSRISYGSYRAQYALDQRGADALDRYEDNREHMVQLTSAVAWQLSETHVLTVGFDQLSQRLDSARLQSRGTRARFALFLQHEWNLYEEGERAVRLLTGARLDADSQFGTQVSPKLAVRADLNAHWTLRAAYGRGFRAPSFQELLLRFENPSVGYVVYGNEDLDAELSHSVDASVTWRPIARLALDVAFFRNDLRQMITTVTVSQDGGGTRFSYDNLESAWTMGMEAGIRYRPSEALDLRASYTLTGTHNGETGQRLEGRALHRVTLSPHVAIPDWDLGLQARSAMQIGRVFYGADGATDPGILLQVDLRLYKAFGDHFEASLGIDNLTDAGDAYAALRPRTFYGGVRGRF